MKLYVMRHGEALPVGGDVREDSQRPLSPTGKTQVRRVAEGLKRRSESVAAVISSPLRRAQETARITAEVMGVPSIETSKLLAPSASPAGLRSMLTSYIKTPGVLLVGHHPDVTLWIGFLAGIDPSACPLFGTASVAAMETDGSGKKTDFLWFQTSEQLSKK